MGDNVTEKDYDAFFEGFRNGAQKDKAPRFGEMMNGALRHFGMSVPSQAKQTTKTAEEKTNIPKRQNSGEVGDTAKLVKIGINAADTAGDITRAAKRCLGY